MSKESDVSSMDNAIQCSRMVEECVSLECDSSSAVVAVLLNLLHASPNKFINYFWTIEVTSLESPESYCLVSVRCAI